jgi:hypothetical protein
MIKSRNVCTDCDTPKYEVGNNAELNWRMFCVKKLWVSTHNALLYKRGVIKTCLCTWVGTGIKIILLRTELRASLKLVYARQNTKWLGMFHRLLRAVNNFMSFVQTQEE